jgi:hypothetical protein
VNDSWLGKVTKLATSTLDQQASSAEAQELAKGVLDFAKLVRHVPGVDRTDLRPVMMEIDVDEDEFTIGVENIGHVRMCASDCDVDEPAYWMRSFAKYLQSYGVPVQAKVKR